MKRTIFLAVAILSITFFAGSAFAGGLTEKEKQIYEEIKLVSEDPIFYGIGNDGLSDSEYQNRRDNIRKRYGISEADIRVILSKVAEEMTSEEVSICEDAIVELALEQARPGFTRESVEKVLGEIAAKYEISVRKLKDLVYKMSVL